MTSLPSHSTAVPSSASTCAELFAARVRIRAQEARLPTVRILDAGCGGPDARPLADPAASIACEVTGVDVDDPAVRARATARADLDRVLLGDLRQVPLPPRAFDVVHCTYLLERSRQAELILDRFVATLKPGGLLLLRLRDRGSAYGFCDRMLPDRLRQLLWRWLAPRAAGEHSAAGEHRAGGEHRAADERPAGGRPAGGRPAGGPPPAVYERIVSAAGIRWYATMRGLVVAEEYGLRSAAMDRHRVVAAACRLLDRLTHGRLDAGNDERAFVIRKPENRYARVLCTTPPTPRNQRLRQ